MNKTLKYALILVLGIAVGIGLSELDQVLERNYYHVWVLNNTECNLESATVLYGDLDIEVKSSEVGYDDGILAQKIEIPILKQSGETTYKLKVEFSDCSVRVSEGRTAKGGWLIYEWVNDESIEMDIRA